MKEANITAHCDATQSLSRMVCPFNGKFSETGSMAACRAQSTSILLHGRDVARRAGAIDLGVNDICAAHTPMSGHTMKIIRSYDDRMS